MRSDQIPFVQNKNRTFALFLDYSGDPFVLGRHAHREIDNENTQISATNATLRTHDAENFDRGRMFSTPANSGGVDENKFPAIALVKNVNGITRRPRQFAHDRAIATHNGINERGFTHVWAANDGNGQRRFDV